MKILILSDNFPPESGAGAEKVAFDLSCEFSKKGHQVFVINTTQDKKKEKLGVDFNGMKIYRIYVPDYHNRWKAYLSLYNPKAIKKVEKILQEIKPDVVHAHNIHYYLSYYSLRLAKKYSRAVFLTAHDVMSFHYSKLFEFVDQDNLNISKKFDYKINPWQQIKRFKKRYNPFRNIIIRYYLKYVDKIIAVSRALKEALNRNGIGNVEVIHNGIDSENWQISRNKEEQFKNKFNLNNKKVVLFGGRLSTLKGGNKILEAMESVSKEIPNAVLLVLGRKDSYADKMEQIAKEKRINIIFTGWIEKEELKSAYWVSDIVVTPSIYLDPFPTVNLEAMACKKPVVGTCFGGTPEIVEDKKTGYIINPFNVKEMSKKIINLLENKEKAEKFGKTGYIKILNNFTLNRKADKYLKKFKRYV